MRLPCFRLRAAIEAEAEEEEGEVELGAAIETRTRGRGACFLNNSSPCAASWA
jgi:hypothetical protein